MPVPEPLQRLCELAGVQTAYHDVWGRLHEASPSALIATLAELGIDATDPPAAEAAWHAARRREPLPPVHVVPTDAAQWSIPLHMPAAASASVRWRIVEEGGRVHAGEASVTFSDESIGEGTVTASRAATLSLCLSLPTGYHRLSLEGHDASCVLIVAPQRCHRPSQLEGEGRLWGAALQLYALRSARNWGIGDFTDLARMAEVWAAKGADLIGVNPLHALFAHNPWHDSPYSPSSRQHLNTLYLDVEAIDDFRECEAARTRVNSAEFRAQLAALRAADTVDYPGVAAAKIEILRLLHASFRRRHGAGSARAADFEHFRAERGAALRRHASFEAMQARFHAQDAAIWGWPVWPQACRDPDSAQVAQFVAEHEDEVGFFEYLQWQADRQLARVAERCRACGMAIGLYLDLAVSVDRGGSDTWAHAHAYAGGASVGAPPDELNVDGQNWGLPPLHPQRSRRDGHSLFVQTLRAVMRHAGAVRIDHVMGLMRLFWVPAGGSARDGAYVRYPLEELLAIVALESVRARCLVIGEDLGTVPEEMRAAMSRHGLLSYRLLYFERDRDGDFAAPAAYPRQAIVAVGTHDLPPLAGWWSAYDLVQRRMLQLDAQPELHDAQLTARQQDRVRLLQALRRADLLPPEVDIEQTTRRPMTPELVQAVHAWLARAPAQLMLVQMEDVLGLQEQVNLPGTTGEHPNWRRKLPSTVETIAADARVDALARTVAAVRPRPQQQAPLRQPAAIIPRATYRLQLHGGFDFDAAIRIVPYLARLGVSHVYCSPILRARPGSAHCYDVVAHGEIHPELGGAEGFERFCEALRAHGMGLLLDVVPNHMGVLGADNPWWFDVLENGPSSHFAGYFDIDWQPVNPELRGKVLLPVLGDHYGAVLDRGELSLAFEPQTGGLVMRYYEHRFPIDPRSYPAVLNEACAAMPGGPDQEALAGVIAALRELPARDVAMAAATTASIAAARARRARDGVRLKRRLAELAQRAELRRCIEQAVAGINAQPARDALHGLHEQQAYRLAHWRTAGDEVNYRRFFDIDELAALRIDDPEVFEATHGFVLDLAAAGRVNGLRIDHPDGLRDPAQYFERLQQAYARRAGLVTVAGGDAPARPLYVVIEKIAAPHEEVPRHWAVLGTTGYRFAMLAGGVLLDADNADEFERLWREFSAEEAGFEELKYQGKRAVMRQALASELLLLATMLARIARSDRHTRDYTLNALRAALAEVAACMPVYRTYVTDRASEQDRRHVDWALARARRRWQTPDPTVFDFVRRALLLEQWQSSPPLLSEQVRRFAARFQQFCAPVAAKGVEDTAFYRYYRLTSLNEVGGDPAVFGLSVRAFHGASADRAAHWPHTLLGTSTHDNKRSEDVRNRIGALSEMPSAWRSALRRWRRMARSYRTEHHDEHDQQPMPGRADEYLLYQTVLGTWPIAAPDEAALNEYRRRIEAYMLKAAREAKQHTSWTAPDAAYEQALSEFVGRVLAPVEPNPLLKSLRMHAGTLVWFGALNSLSMVLMKLTSPGVPDIYQGNELLDFSLVDPDNRRPVDYDRRAAELDRLTALWASRERLRALETLAARLTDGRLKLWFTWRLLELRRRMPELFSQGAYTALTVSGARTDHVLAYARSWQGFTLIVITGRLFARLLGRPRRLPFGAQVWGDTAVRMEGLPPRVDAEEVLTGEIVQIRDGSIGLADAFRRVPGAALLIDMRQFDARETDGVTGHAQPGTWFANDRCSPS